MHCAGGYSYCSILCNGVLLYSVAYDGDIQSADPVAAVNLKAYACS